jgi:hypothetical protein
MNPIPTVLPQEFANLTWGTRMPVPVRLGSGIAAFILQL